MIKQLLVKQKEKRTSNSIFSAKINQYIDHFIPEVQSMIDQLVDQGNTIISVSYCVESNTSGVLGGSSTDFNRYAIIVYDDHK